MNGHAMVIVGGGPTGRVAAPVPVVAVKSAKASRTVGYRIQYSFWVINSSSSVSRCGVVYTRLAIFRCSRC